MPKKKNETFFSSEAKKAVAIYFLIFVLKYVPRNLIITEFCKQIILREKRVKILWSRDSFFKFEMGLKYGFIIITLQIQFVMYKFDAFYSGGK